MDQPFAYLKRFGDLPGPGLTRTRADSPAAGCLKGARVAGRVIEEREHEHQPTLGVYGHIAPVADAGDEVQQARLKLLAAAPLA